MVNQSKKERKEQKQQADRSRRSFIKRSVAGGIAAVGLNRYLRGESNGSVSYASSLPKIVSTRKLGRTGFSVSDIGIGAPWNEGILNAALNGGINYIDTAEAYHNGHSERTIGRVIKNRDRKKLFITTKLGLRGTESKAYFLNRARKCLERLDTDYIDCMMIHAASSSKEVLYKPFLDATDQLKREGKIRFVGVASHGTQWSDEREGMDDILLAAVKTGKYDVMLLVYNFLQQAIGERVINAAKEKNIGITAMKTNPVGNYYRAIERMDPKNPTHASLRGFYKEYLPRFKQMADASQAFIKKHRLDNPNDIRDASVKFALSHPGIHTVLGSMDNFETMEAFLKLSGKSLSGSENRKLGLFKHANERFYCRHACNICEGKCPKQIPVNTIMRYNYYFEAKQQEKYAMQAYGQLKNNNAGSCGDCPGHCENACPYNVSIRGLLTSAHQNLSMETLT